MSKEELRIAGFTGKFGEGFWSSRPGKTLEPPVPDNNTVERADKI